MPGRQPSGKLIPSMDFQNQQAAKYWPEGHPQLTTSPEWYFPMLDNIPLFFVMTLWSHVHTNYSIG